MKNNDESIHSMLTRIERSVRSGDKWENLDISKGDIRELLTYIEKLRAISDAAHDVLKSYDESLLYEYNAKDEPLTNEQLLDSRLRRLIEAMDDEIEFVNNGC